MTTVLVVDDERAVRDGLATWLGRRRFSVVTASNLETAVAGAAKHRPDVILLDVKLGVEDGLDLIVLLRNAWLQIPCVVFTAHAGPRDGFKAHELGVAALIEKPSSPDEIAETLRRVAGSSHRDHAVHHARKFVGARTRYVTEAARLVEERFKTKGLNVEALARSVEVSPGHLSKTFRRETGSSVVAYIHERRVAHAAHLLTTTLLSIKAIADECGYHGSSELHRHFTKRFARSPQGYRFSQGTESSI